MTDECLKQAVLAMYWRVEATRLAKLLAEVIAWIRVVTEEDLVGGAPIDDALAGMRRTGSVN